MNKPTELLAHQQGIRKGSERSSSSIVLRLAMTTGPNPLGEGLAVGLSALVDQQKRVDAHFRSSAPYWKQIYHLEGLDSTIYQLRRAVVLELVDKLQLSRGSRILELGCGAGLTAVELARRGYRVDAVDTVGAMLDLTRRAATEAGLKDRVRTSAADTHQLAFRSGTFDLLVAMGVVPWLHSLPRALQEMARVIRPGGRVILTTDNRWCLNHTLDPWRFPGLRPARWKVRQTLERFGLRKLRSPRPRLHMYSIRQLDSFLLAAGLRKVEGRTLGFGPFSFLNHELFSDLIAIMVHRQLQRLADRRFPVIRSGGIEYVVLARRPDVE